MSKQPEVLVELEALKRHSFRAFTAIVTRIIDAEGAPQQQRQIQHSVTQEALDCDIGLLADSINRSSPFVRRDPVRPSRLSTPGEDLERLPSVAAHSDLDSNDRGGDTTIQVSESDHDNSSNCIATTPLLAAPLTGRRRRSINEAASDIVHRVRRLSASASSGWTLPGLLSSAGSKAKPPSSPSPPPKDNSDGTDLLQVMSDHNIALLLGAFCKAIFQFLEEEPAVASVQSVALPLVVRSCSSAAVPDSIPKSELKTVDSYQLPALVLDDRLAIPGDTPSGLMDLSYSPADTHTSPVTTTTPQDVALTVQLPAAAAAHSDASQNQFGQIAVSIETIQSAFASNTLSGLSESKRLLWDEIVTLLPVVYQMSRLHAMQIERLALASSAASISPATGSTLNDLTAPPDLSKRRSLDLSEILAMCPDGAPHYPGVDELTKVIKAIDHICNIAPRMDNQTVSLSDSKRRDISAAQLIGLIERLNRGAAHYADQRACSTTKLSTLNFLMDAIAQSAKRRLDSQRFTMSAEQSRNMDMNKLGGLVEHAQKYRLANQDWMSREQRMCEDLAILQNLAANTSELRMPNQRFELTAEKQRNMFICKIGGSIERGEQRRLTNQEAILDKEELREFQFLEVEGILDNARGMRQMSGQRANMSSPNLGERMRKLVVGDTVPLSLS
ncbi:hypothetical protein BASA83_006128 [Batrachochytrium salamandrivorans]|nr:hypothetical protein BASA83_006128 [Batrachochytrium salamandrivorans]